MAKITICLEGRAFEKLKEAAEVNEVSLKKMAEMILAADLNNNLDIIDGKPKAAFDDYQDW